MKLKNIFIYSLDFFHSNKYLKVNIQPIEPRIFNEKFEVLVDFYRQNKTAILISNILGSKDCMITSKYSFDRKKYRE